jgi:hypothetical protein
MKTASKLHFRSVSDKLTVSHNWFAACGRLVNRLNFAGHLLEVTCRGCRKAAALTLREQVAFLLKQHTEGSTRAGNEAWDIAEKLTAMLTVTPVREGAFEELLEAWPKHGYRPTLRADLNPFADVLSDIYDYAQARRNRAVKAYRG